MENSMDNLHSIIQYELILNEAMRNALEFDVPDEEINEFLKFFGKRIGCDRIYVFEDNFANHTTSNTYEWCNEGVSPEIENLQDVDMDSIDYWYEAFKSGRGIVIEDLEAIKDTEPNTYAILKPQNINSLVVYPLKHKGKIIGFFGVDNPNISESHEITTILDVIQSFLVSLLKLRDKFNEVENEAKLNGFKPLAEIYLSMHLIDLKTGKMKSIKSNAWIDKQLRLEYGLNFNKQIKIVMEKLANESYLDSVIEFTDITTLNSRLKGKKTVVCEFLGNVNGWCKARFIPVEYDEDGDLASVIFTVEIIDEEKRRENHLLYLSQTDLMTGIRNRGSGEASVDELISSDQKGLFCIMDCDKFKSINDTYGHNVGDKVLIAVAKALEVCCGQYRETNNSVVMRLGGDEFALFISDVIDKANATDFIDKLFGILSKIRIEEMGERQIFASLGATFCLSDDESFDKLYRKADHALYESKKIEGYKATFS